MARDPKRIEIMFDKIRKIWYRYPDLRLGQLLVNVIPVTNPAHYDPFYIEDEDLMKLLDRYLEGLEHGQEK